MKVMPTLEGGLRIDVETTTDWLVLEQIANDAVAGGTEHLPERLGALMDEGSNWDEVVIPELQVYFSGQLRVVADAVHEAHENAELPEEGEEPAGEVFIGREEATEWYGALNQARLALETRYRFGPTQDITGLAEFSDSKRAAFIRSQFYCALQSVLLEHVIQ